MSETAPPATRSGALWSIVNGGAAVVIPFGVFVLFARMMSPHELSPILLAVAMLEIVKALGPQGVYDVVIRQPESDTRHYESAAALFLIFGLGLAAVFCGLVLISPLILRITLPPVLMILGLKIVFDYLVMQPQAILARRMAFRRLGARGLTAGIVSGTGGLAIAALLSPLLGLASYYVLQSLMVYLLTAVGTGATMPPRLDRPAMREMAAEGARASGVRLTAVGFNYLDQLMLGAMVLPAQLGLYNLGKRIEVVAITIVSSFGQMMFQPVFATADPGHRAHHMGRGIAAISLVCGVPLVVLALHASLAVPFIFGAQWLPAAPVVALLGLGGLARALGGVAGALLTVSGRNALLLRMGFWAAAISVAMIFGLASFGVAVVAAGVLARNIVFTGIQFHMTGDAKGQLWRLFLHNCFLPLAAVAVVSVAAGMIVTALLGAGTPLAIFAVLAAAGLAGGGVGAALLYPRM
ncbi:oligosaccharide flippase family protein [Sphingomonas solaris]|uniref:Oligosaccharide flippase family protein n=1 Tax=Alterirhizorhabdus solaris TaxID=2529389 RepID=A0A558R0P9_9SPHN|nr:oligosaccharide flippase family protein [Sphingomonas solaris]TVV72918.1 oligosaccharide flippase family protein [Sphingomonas solaris]